MLTVLPAGLASDRFGRIRLMQLGIAGSCAAGVAIALLPSAPLVAIARVAEGVATGLFVSASLAYVNSRQDQGRLSGLFMASLSAGLLVGLVGTGILVQVTGSRIAGVVVFTVLALASLALIRGRDEATGVTAVNPLPRLIPVLSQYRWLFYATIVIFGAGGAVTGLYPGLSTAAPGLLGVQIALQNVATIVAILVVSRQSFEPIPVIQGSALVMAGAVALSFFSPYGFAVIGAAAGAVQIAQLGVPGKDGRAAGPRDGRLQHGLVRGDGGDARRRGNRRPVHRVRGGIRPGRARLAQRRPDDRSLYAVPPVRHCRRVIL